MFVILCCTLWLEFPTGKDKTNTGIFRNNKVNTMATDALPPWASYQIRKIAGCECAGNAGNVFPRRQIQRKPLVSDPGMHHGTCVTHVPWCMSESLTRGGGKTFPVFPAHAHPQIYVSGNRPMFHAIQIHGISYAGYMVSCTEWILGLRPAKKRRRYFVTTSLIGRAQT